MSSQKEKEITKIRSPKEQIESLEREIQRLKQITREYENVISTIKERMKKKEEELNHEML